MIKARSVDKRMALVQAFARLSDLDRNIRKTSAVSAPCIGSFGCPWQRGADQHA